MPVNIVKSETNVTTFVFNNGSNLTPAKAVRVVTIKGEPWFVAADVCKALGFDQAGGATRYTGNLDQIEVGSHQVRKGGRPNAIISESGLYKLIMRSDKPEAKQFQNWVTQQVLPSIRKGGADSNPSLPPRPIRPDQLVRRHDQAIGWLRPYSAVEL